MPTYIYRAINKSGTIVRNRVEEGNKITLIRKLKGNGLLPISITQTVARKSQATKKKRNVTDIQEVLKNVNTTQVVVNVKNRMS